MAWQVLLVSIDARVRANDPPNDVNSPADSLTCWKWAGAWQNLINDGLFRLRWYQFELCRSFSKQLWPSTHQRFNSSTTVRSVKVGR